ncbi:hypothetical protein [Synechocystis sp. LKSZ1]|uniref:hypothetical protein n=1 Tax=Synechocystis sp. LKSZ1 TaxID=3144951 RepID=UPI00336C1CAA
MAAPLQDGIYLYGQSAQAEQIGQEYFVFQLKNGSVKGALYLPRSEYNCVSGQINGTKMTLAIKDSYENTVYPYSITVLPPSPVAGPLTAGGQLRLEGYQRLAEVSDNDRRILQDCLNTLSPAGN